MASRLLLPLYITPSGLLLKKPGYADRYTASTRIPLKRGSAYQIRLFFSSTEIGTSTYLLTAGSEVKVSLKEKGKFDAMPLVSASTTTTPATATDPYLIDLVLNTVDLNDLIFDDDDPANDLEQVDVEFEVSWTEDGWVTKQASNERVVARVVNDTHKEGDSVPTSGDTLADWLTARAVRFDAAQTLTDPQKVQALANLGLPFLNNNYSATVAPSITDDSSLGYGVGSIWIDVTGKEAYRCVDATLAASVWIESTLDASEVSAIITAAIASPQSITVSGSITDGTDPIKAVLLQVIPSIYTSAVGPDLRSYSIEADTDGFAWVLNVYNNSVFVGQWTSMDAVSNPLLVTTWTPDAVVTGTPVLTNGNYISALAVLTAIGYTPSSPPVEVADATARKLLASYTTPPQPGMLVRQVSATEVLWVYFGGDITSDAAWMSLARSPSAPYNAGSSVAGDLSINCVNGLLQKATFTGATADRSVNVPSNGVEGNFMTVRITCDSSMDRTISFNPAIVIPSDSIVSFPKAILSGKSYFVKMYYNGTAWELLTLTGGY